MARHGLVLVTADRFNKCTFSTDNTNKEAEDANCKNSILGTVRKISLEQYTCLYYLPIKKEITTLFF